jgi:hypothetical protein
MGISTRWRTWAPIKKALELGEHFSFLSDIAEWFGLNRPLPWLLYIFGSALSGVLAQAAHWSAALIFLATISAGVALAVFYAAMQSIFRSSAVLTRHKSKCFALSHVHSESRAVKWGRPKAGNSNLYETIVYIPVGNALTDGRMLKRVQARVFQPGGPATIARIRGIEAGEIDLRHGEWAYFEIGRIVWSEWVGNLQGSIVLGAEARRQYEHNVPRGYLSFEIRPFGDRGYGLGYTPGAEPFAWTMRFSADDATSTTIVLKIDMSKTETLVTYEMIE